MTTSALAAVVCFALLACHVLARDLHAPLLPQETSRIPKADSSQKGVHRNLRGQDAPTTPTSVDASISMSTAQQSEPSSSVFQTIAESNGDRPAFDFVVAGFPKCGTTTLLKAFGKHEETDMAESEQCAIASPGQADHVIQRKLDETLVKLSDAPSVKRSFKCPTAMYNFNSITRLEEHSPDAKLVIGMRHPVKMLQSFYNYRVTEIYERNLKEDIPTLHQVVASGTPWKGVSLEATRFELFLIQMGKTVVSVEQLMELVGRQYELAIKPTAIPVFLYTVDQLEDEDEARSELLRKDMQTFLGLSKPIEPFGHENVNHHVGKHGHKESIDICDAEYDDIRAVLTSQGKNTAAWLEEFIQSPEVTVANKEHFVTTLATWGVDPCETSAVM